MNEVASLHPTAKRVRLRVRVRGVVQGVGFRPFVHRLATRLQLSGQVYNSPEGVLLEIEGDEAATQAFIQGLRREAPPLAEVHALDWEAIAATGQRDFVIQPSSGSHAEQVLVPPDVATCPRCLQELADPADRRYRYPFINCTDCGPRYTIIGGLPYDRPRTTMAGFELCPECRAEYGEITCRRYHAQPVACPQCGPRIWLTDPTGHPLDCTDAIAETAARLRQGQIGAIKGLGGFHLACDATNAAAVEQLRLRKGRAEKPFAVMARDVAAAERFAEILPAEREVLASWRRPIVLLRAREPNPLAPGVCGASRWVGTMLPYTPLHQLLLEATDCLALVMTSGNFTDEPIIHENEVALARLGGVVDFFLLHDRPILARADDSVVRLLEDSTVTITRRSRGYVPQPVLLPLAPPDKEVVLATGGDLKSTCCITRSGVAILSQHIGDLEHEDAGELLGETAQHLLRLFGVQPTLVVHDLHPDYYSTRYAEEWTSLPRLAVQHHHAHALACLAENGWTAPALAIVLDGTGYGTDGTIWGGELLEVRGLDFARLAHFKALPLPGGDRAAREPWRMAIAALVDAYGASESEAFADLAPTSAAAPEFVRAVVSLAARPGSCPLTSSTGRLFDAMAALLGARQRINYEGQAAMELEQLASTEESDEPYPYDLLEGAALRIDMAPMFRQVVEELRRGAAPSLLARRFHVTLARALTETTAKLSERCGIRTVALSGGSLQNRILHRQLRQGLEARGHQVLVHRQVPPNDGGLSLGQAWAGVLELLRRRASPP